MNNIENGKRVTDKKLHVWITQFTHCTPNVVLGAEKSLIAERDQIPSARIECEQRLKLLTPICDLLRSTQSHDFGVELTMTPEDGKTEISDCFDYFITEYCAEWQHAAIACMSLLYEIYQENTE